VGYDAPLSEKARGDVRKNMLSKKQLDAKRHAAITFASPVTTTATVSASMQIEATPESFRAAGGFSARHADWGFSPYTAMMGALKNMELLRFNLSVSGAPSG